MLLGVPRYVSGSKSFPMILVYGIISRLEWEEVQMYFYSPSIDSWQKLIVVGPKLVLATCCDSESRIRSRF